MCAPSSAIYVLLPMKRRLSRIRSSNWSDQSVRSLFHGIFILDTCERERERSLFVRIRRPAIPCLLTLYENRIISSFFSVSFFFIVPTSSHLSRESMSLIIEPQSHFLLVDTPNNFQAKFVFLIFSDSSNFKIYINSNKIFSGILLLILEIFSFAHLCFYNNSK